MDGSEQLPAAEAQMAMRWKIHLEVALTRAQLANLGRFVLGVLAGTGLLIGA